MVLKHVKKTSSDEQGGPWASCFSCHVDDTRPDVGFFSAIASKRLASCRAQPFIPGILLTTVVNARCGLEGFPPPLWSFGFLFVFGFDAFLM